ncbi:hypothetical protein [Geobacter sp. SVR]|uniref:hypothetical protein n=1 Tax=Geobacter sp. SVR TaxID=2495594 RepID=UPI0019500FED|nr:hypothetical protein [Geobacter sp. SVR]
MLIADDNEKRRKNLVGIFSAYCEVDSVEGGAEAVALFMRCHDSSKPYTFIVLSHPIRTMEAPEAFRLIRAYEQRQGCLSKSTICVLSSTPDCREVFSGLLGNDPQVFFHFTHVDPSGLLALFRESTQKRLAESVRKKIVPSMKTRLDFYS